MHHQIKNSTFRLIQYLYFLVKSFKNCNHQWQFIAHSINKDDQCKFDALSRALKASALGQPRGMEWGGM